MRPESQKPEKKKLTQAQKSQNGLPTRRGEAGKFPKKLAKRQFGA